MLKIALPSGEMLSPTLDLFQKTRIGVTRKLPRQFDVRFSGISILDRGWIEKSVDIPRDVASGEFDVGIATLDLILEAQARVVMCADLQFNRATTGRPTEVVLYCRRGRKLKGAEQVPHGSIVCSEFPNLTRRFFKERGRRVVVIPSRGSTESLIARKGGFGVSLREKGGTLDDNDLKVVERMVRSGTFLIANQKAFRDSRKGPQIAHLTRLLKGTVSARDSLMLEMNVPKDRLKAVLAALPKREGQSPDIQQLADPTWVSVTYLVQTGEFNDLEDKLYRIGARSIVAGAEETVIP
jgi:ATP phosphoribosyltransferase